jgi:hypothetical protein
MQFVRRFFTALCVLAAIVFAVLFFTRGCGRGPLKPVTIIETVTDTQYIPFDAVTPVYRPPYQALEPSKSTPLYAPSPPLWLTKRDTITREVDTAAILAAYNEVRTYSDTIRNAYGYVLVEDTVSQNAIMMRKATSHFDVPQITTKTTRTINRVQVYLGMGLLGSKTNPLGGFTGTAMLKTKRDKVYQIESGLANGEVYYGAKILFKLKF